MEGMETRMTGEREDTVGTETTKITRPSQEVEGMLSSEEENPEVSSSSEEETTGTDESEDQFEGEGSSEVLPPLPSLTREEQGHPRRRGRTRQWARGTGRPSDRDEELSFTTFDKCTDTRSCGTHRESDDTTDHCTGCTVRQTGSGFRHPWEGLLKVQSFRSVWQQGTDSKFMEQLREEGSPDWSLVGEELLQAQSRGLITWTTGTKGRSHRGLQSSFWSSMGIGARTDGP
jgi:hypothetical protein